MNIKVLTSLTLAAILAPILLFCASNKPNEPVQEGLLLPTKSVTVYNLLDLPAWLLYPQKGINAVGIALDSKADKYNPVVSATEFAATSLALNQGAFAIDKSALIKYSEQDTIGQTQPDFKVKLIPDIQFRESGKYPLKQIAESAFGGYRVFLLSTEDMQPNNDIIKTNAGKTPEWCLSQSTKTEGDFLYVVGTGEDTSLENAWQQAHKTALHKIAQFRLANVIDALRKTDDAAKKEQIIDQSMSSIDASFVQNWLYNKTIDGKSSYNVFIMLKATK